jgi:hypothetical protein
MPQNKDLKRLVRARMAETGERYTEALARLLSQTKLRPLPAAWQRTGTRAHNYDAGLLPEDMNHEGNRVVELRLRPDAAELAGFGTVMQSIAATRYLNRRVRFSAMARTWEVTGWAGLWLRIDGPGGVIALDNMQERPLRGTTGWTEAEIVLDVPPEATELHFGVLLDGAGAVDLTRPRFDVVGKDVPVTRRPFQTAALPEEPQALDFSTSSR